MGRPHQSEPGGSGRVRLVAVGPLEFVTRDGTLRLRFAALPFGTDVEVERGSGVQGELGK